MIKDPQTIVEEITVSPDVVEVARPNGGYTIMRCVAVGRQNAKVQIRDYSGVGYECLDAVHLHDRFCLMVYGFSAHPNHDDSVTWTLEGQIHKNRRR